MPKAHYTSICTFGRRKMSVSRIWTRHWRLAHVRHGSTSREQTCDSRMPNWLPNSGGECKGGGNVRRKVMLDVHRLALLGAFTAAAVYSQQPQQPRLMPAPSPAGTQKMARNASPDARAG